MTKRILHNIFSTSNFFINTNALTKLKAKEKEVKFFMAQAVQWKLIRENKNLNTFFNDDQKKESDES